MSRRSFTLGAAMVILAALLPAAARARPLDVAGAVSACAGASGIRVSGTVLCFTGDIDRDSAARAGALMADRGLTAFVVDSDGGEVTAALRLARALRARALPLVVARRCISSCANFLFPAARTKAVAPHGLVIFHGGIAPGAFGGLFGGGEERDLLAQTTAFFREIGVDGSITYDPPYRPGTRVLAEEWTATPAALRRHGVTGLVAMWWPSNEAVIREGAGQGISLGIVE